MNNNENLYANDILKMYCDKYEPRKSNILSTNKLTGIYIPNALFCNLNSYGLTSFGPTTAEITIHANADEYGKYLYGYTEEANSKVRFSKLAQLKNSRIIQDGPCTILLNVNNERLAMVKCMDSDMYKQERGIIFCVCRFLLTANEWNKIIRPITNEDYQYYKALGIVELLISKKELDRYLIEWNESIKKHYDWKSKKKVKKTLKQMIEAGYLYYKED